jgi:glycosyltransferase involved in cell wall biosynthesis
MMTTPKSPIPVSAYIICLNEERNIGRLLESIQDFEEVIAVDSGSRDRTVQIAQSFPNVKVFHQDWLGYACQKAYALSLCTKPWVMNLDADEMVSDLLLKEIAQTVALEDCEALSVPWCDTFLGHIPNRFCAHHDKIRLFKKECGHYDPAVLVHESITVKGRIKKANGLLYHYGLDTLDTAVDKTNKYSSLAALQKFEKGKRTSLLRLVTAFPLAFIKAYFLRRYGLDGRLGFIYSVNIAYYAFLKEAKLMALYMKKN